PGVRTELAGRQLAFDSIGLSGVSAARKVFVPGAGGFARFLDTITNDSGADVTLEVQVEGALNCAVKGIVVSSATGNTYAVTASDTFSDNVASYDRPTLAHVFNGPAAAATVSSVSFQSLLGTSHYSWTLTIPAGQSRSLLHFAVQRDAGNTAG